MDVLSVISIEDNSFTSFIKESILLMERRDKSSLAMNSIFKIITKVPQTNSTAKIIKDLLANNEVNKNKLLNYHFLEKMDSQTVFWL